MLMPKKTPSSSTDNIAPTETIPMVLNSTVLPVPSVVHGVLEDVVPGVVPDTVPVAVIQLSPSVPRTASTEEPMVLSSQPLLSTHDNVQFVAVHSPATAKNLRKTRKTRKK
jgi:hypothetical protein